MNKSLREKSSSASVNADGPSRDQGRASPLFNHLSSFAASILSYDLIPAPIHFDSLRLTADFSG
jgi:hypothetical protein